MTQTTARIRPRWPRFAHLCESMATAALRGVGSLTKSYGPSSNFARQALRDVRAKIDAGETAYLLGITPGGHNTGAALVEVSRAAGIRMLSNHEEERFRGEKHCMKFPSQAIGVLQEEMTQRGLTIDSIDAIMLGWDYQRWGGGALAAPLGELPGGINLFRKAASPVMRPSAAVSAMLTPRKMKNLFGAHARIPVIHQRHHDNHAAFSYAVSPFAGSDSPVGIVVLDGSGDDGAISWYVGQRDTVELRYRNDSIMDSLGLMYGALSSALGGWPHMQSEGRFMGAAAWGNMNRLTNPYYSQLRGIFHYGDEGTVSLNRAMAGWHLHGFRKPFTPQLTSFLGKAIPPEDMWNPDAVLNVDDIEHAEITQDRVDKAAAVQLVFEDALFHIVGHVIRCTGADRLILAGGTALNCVANMRVLEHFDEKWFARYLGRQNTRLHLWVPPIPNDEGVAAGAAFNFAMQAGAPLKPDAGRLNHAFYCGRAPTQQEISDALSGAEDVRSIELGNVSHPDQRERIADLLASIIAQDGVVGLYQGVAETGPRALGHRSILANPTNPETLKVLNSRVKFREAIRPLAPMATLEGALTYFDLSPGASDDDYNGYNYMILTAPANERAREEVPAVVHFDGTGRVQIVREETDPFTHAYLRAMGRRVGAEVSVNTSLNVGAPIAQTPDHAITTLKRSGGMHGLLLIADDGTATMAWHHVLTEHKDEGRTLQGWLEQHSPDLVTSQA